MRVLAAALVVVALVIPAAIGHGGEPTQPLEDHDIDERFTLEDAGEAAEANIFARADESIVYRVTTNGEPVYFDIHFHEPTGGVNSPVMDESTNATSGTFIVPSDGDYSVYVLRAKEGPSNVRFQLEGFFALESVSGFTISEGGDSPAPPLVALLGSLALLFFARRR